MRISDRANITCRASLSIFLFLLVFAVAPAATADMFIPAGDYLKLDYAYTGNIYVSGPVKLWLAGRLEIDGGTVTGKIILAEGADVTIHGISFTLSDGTVLDTSLLS